jgi:hypothetical protein
MLLLRAQTLHLGLQMLSPFYISLCSVLFPSAVTTKDRTNELNICDKGGNAPTR